MIEQNKDKVVLLLCLSPSPSSKRVIHAASKLMQTPDAKGIALYVASPRNTSQLDLHIQGNMKEAKEHGFEVHTLESNDIAIAIAEYASRMQATDLFIGNTPAPIFFPTKKALFEQLTELLNDTDIHVIPDAMASSLPGSHVGTLSLNIKDFTKVLAIMSIATLLSMAFDRSPFSNANIITIYILAVLIASLWTSHRFYGIVAAVLYILLFNFLFITPRFTLLVYDPEYVVTYLVTVIAALITGTIASSVKTIARRSAENAYQAKVLLDTSSQLERADSFKEIIDVTCVQLMTLLNCTILFYSKENEDPQIYSTNENTIQTSKEEAARQWAWQNKHRSGAYTSHYTSCNFQYICIHSENQTYGIIGIDMSIKPLSEFETLILHSILHEFTMAMDNQRMVLERQKAEISAEKERMRSNLLRSISHDLRTPLTSIYGNATNLSDNSQHMNEEDKIKIYQDIASEATLLTEQMENILAITKLENDSYVKLSVENVEDILEESIRRFSMHSKHPIQTKIDGDYFAWMDANRIVQVLVNLLSNAQKYTPQDSKIQIHIHQEEDLIVFDVIDDGPGISPEDKEHIFDLFYTGKTRADSQRSMGIGLNLCATILKAHHSTIQLRDNSPHGSIFTFKLKAEEVDAYE